MGSAEILRLPSSGSLRMTGFWGSGLVGGRIGRKSGAGAPHSKGVWGCRGDVGWVGSKSRDLGNDRGYRVARWDLRWRYGVGGAAFKPAPADNGGCGAQKGMGPSRFAGGLARLGRSLLVSGEGGAEDAHAVVLGEFCAGFGGMVGELGGVGKYSSIVPAGWCMTIRRAVPSLVFTKA
jgi:hypothetical protein